MGETEPAMYIVWFKYETLSSRSPWKPISLQRPALPPVKAIAGVCAWVPLILLVYTIENQQLKKFELINEIKTY